MLDLSNGNRLLNYKFSDRSRRHVRIVDEIPDQLFGRLDEGRRLVFKSLPEPPDEPKDEKTDGFLLAFEQAKRSDEEYLAALKSVDDEDGEIARRIERALRDRVRKTLRMPDRLLRDQISKAEWAWQNSVEPSFDLPEEIRGPKQSHLDGDLQTFLLPDEMERALSGIQDLTRTTLQETGIPTLYLAVRIP